MGAAAPEKLDDGRRREAFVAIAGNHVAGFGDVDVVRGWDELEELSRMGLLDQLGRPAANEQRRNCDPARSRDQGFLEPQPVRGDPPRAVDEPWIPMP